jgi:hypothetical protein
MKRFILLVAFLIALSASSFAQSPPPLIIREIDGTPRRSNVTELVFPNGTLTRSGSRMTIDLSSLGGGTVTNTGTLAANKIVTGNGTVDLKTSNITLTNPATTATLTLANNSSLITVGAFAVTITATNTTGVTLPLSGTLATVTGAETFQNKTISGANNTLSNIANASLTNSSVTVGSTTIALGATGATVAGLTLTTPTIASFVNATHDHSNAAGGGNVSTTAVTSGNKTGNGTKFATGTGTYTPGNCIEIDADGNLVDSGSACGGGGGGGSPAGSGSEIQYRSDATTFGAVTGSSVSGAAITLTGSPIVQVTDTDETTITTLLTLFHRNIAAVPQQGYGSGILLRGSDDENAADDMGKLSTVWSDPAGGSEDSDFTIQLRTAGAALAEKFRLNSLGSITIAGAPAIIASASNANISVTPNGTGEFRVVNGTTSQKLSVFNTYTSDSNYNKILIDAGSNYGAIMLTGAGGTAFNSSVFYISNGNSSGSLQFQTNNTNRWAMDANGHLLASTDNSFDIGATGATRPRNVHIATGLTVAGAAITNNVVQNSQSAAYTTVLADAGKHILHPIADDNARTFTIAAEASVNYPIGTTITFVNRINTVTIAINSDTLIFAGDGSTGSRTLAANGIATAMKIASGVWIISGSGLT